MLILKGNVGKSRVVDIIASKTNSICLVYGFYTRIFGSLQIDSEDYSLDDFLKLISNTSQEAITNDEFYDYLIAYTNESEEDLQEIINWLEDNKWNIPFRDIILTCK